MTSDEVVDVWTESASPAGAYEPCVVEGIWALELGGVYASFHSRTESWPL